MGWQTIRIISNRMIFAWWKATLLSNGRSRKTGVVLPDTFVLIPHCTRNVQMSHILLSSDAAVCQSGVCSRRNSCTSKRTKSTRNVQISLLLDQTRGVWFTLGRDDFFKTFRRTCFRVSVTKRNCPVCIGNFHHVSHTPQDKHLCDRISYRVWKWAIWVPCSSYLIKCKS